MYKSIKYLDSAKQDAIKIARELFYEKEVIEKIERAESIGEINRILRSARLGEK